MGNLLISLSGARPEILDRCPTERVKFQSLGWALLITSGMAVLSMWFALTSALGLQPVFALPVALIWGGIILGIDRWLITSMPVGSSRRWAVALPRLLLALLLGSLISTPIVLRIFQSEIDAQMTVIKAQRANTYLHQAQHSQVDDQVAIWTRDVASLQRVITSGGQVPINPSADPQVQSLTSQRGKEITLEQGYFQQWQCQLYGGSGCTVKGNGPLAGASENSYLQAKAQVASLTSQITQREQQLASQSAQSRSARLQQARGALPAAQSQLAAATARQKALQASFDAQNESTNGLLIRLEALNQLSSQGFTLNAVRILLFLLFLVIECLPVTVKLLQQPGNYELILKDAAARELREARRDYRPQPRSASQDGTIPLGTGIPADSRAGRQAVLQGIWRAGSQQGWTSTTPTQDLTDPHENAGEAHSASLLDRDLRQLADLGPAAQPVTSPWSAPAAGQSADPGPDAGPDAGMDLQYGEHEL